MEIAEDRSVNLELLAELSGVMGICLVDALSGDLLGKTNTPNSINVDKIAKHYVDLVRAKRKILKELDLKGKVEDVLICMNDQYHVIRPLAGVNDGLFILMILHRATANLAMTRHSIRHFEKTLGDLSL